jgi:4-hydroxybenzoate polyprenyltransferase
VAASQRAVGAASSKPALFARLIKIEHSVYALPFAYAGAFLAADGMPTWGQLFWITVAMIGARSAAMALNRLIDAEVDARNPRTAGRELPSGSLGRREVWAFTLAAVALLVVSAFNLSEPCATCGPSP